MSGDDHLSRLRMMAAGDPTWDLSPKDRQAIAFVLGKLDEYERRFDELKRKLIESNNLALRNFETSEILRIELAEWRTGKRRVFWRLRGAARMSINAVRRKDARQWSAKGDTLYRVTVRPKR